jgi:putative transposase
VLFSSDLTLGYDHLIDYYRLRFQLEFNFSSPYTFFLLNGDMELYRNRHFFI